MMQTCIFLLFYCGSHFLTHDLSHIWQLIPIPSPAVQKAALIQRHRKSPTQWLWEKKGRSMAVRQTQSSGFCMLFFPRLPSFG